MKTTCLGVVYQASAAIDPHNSENLSDISLGRVSSGGSKQQMVSGYPGVRLLCSDFVALQAVGYVKGLQHKGDKQIFTLKGSCEIHHLSTEMFSSLRDKRLKCWDGVQRI